MSLIDIAGFLKGHYEIVDKMQGTIDAQAAEIARLREANGILERALRTVGDDYPGSSCQKWCREQLKAARAVVIVTGAA